MKNIALIVSVFVTIACAGCTTVVYHLSGQTYNSREEAQAAFDLQNAKALSQIDPFPVSLVDRELVIMIPSSQALRTYTIVGSQSQLSSFVRTELQDIEEWRANVNHERLMTLAKAVQNKNIYREATISEQNEQDSNPQPTVTRDYLYTHTDPGTAISAFYLATVASGQTAIGLDGSLSAWSEQVEAFVAQVASAATAAR